MYGTPVSEISEITEISEISEIIVSGRLPLLWRLFGNLSFAERFSVGACNRWVCLRRCRLLLLSEVNLWYSGPSYPHRSCTKKLIHASDAMIRKITEEQAYTGRLCLPGTHDM